MSRLFVLIVFAIMCFGTCKAQGNRFEIKVSDWESYSDVAQWANYKYKHLEFQNYVVIEKDGTAEELYEMIKLYIDMTWNDPDHVVKVDRPNEYIRINGAHDRIYEFRFKDGKIQYKTNLPKFYVSMKKPNGKIKEQWNPFILSAYYQPPLSRSGYDYGWGLAKKYLAEENARIVLIENTDFIEELNNDW